MKGRDLIDECADCRPPNMDEFIELNVELVFNGHSCECGTDVKCNGGYCSSGSYFIASEKLPDSTFRFWVFEEDSDTTGHGCQCNSSLTNFSSLSDAIKLGISQDYRQSLYKRLYEMMTNSKAAVVE